MVENPIELQTVLSHIGVLTLNRPNALNALNLPTLKAMNQALEQIENDPNLRVLVLTGAGAKAFCAGADLKERAGMSLDETRGFVRTISQTFLRLERLAIPTLAAVNGVAFGGGLELALACDFRVFAPSSVVGLTECSLGIIPGAGGTQRLPQLIGPSKAKDLIFTARHVSANEAMQIGLADRMAQDGNALDMAIKWGVQIGQNAPLAIKAAKRAISGADTLAMENRLLDEARAYESILLTEDRKEGLLAFAEKRPPRYVGQ